MRALAAAAALALAGCSVKLDGAPCQRDGNCPADQRCGADLRCAVASCERVCYPGDLGCGVEDGTVVACDAAASVCGTFPVSGGQGCGAGQVCGGASGACTARYQVAVDPFPAGLLVGTGGTTVTARVALGAPSVAPPAVVLKVGSQAYSAMTLEAVSGSTATYSVPYLPTDPEEATLLLQAVAGQGADETASAVVPLAVDTVPPALSAVDVACAAPPLVDGVADPAACRLDGVAVQATVADGSATTVVANVTFSSSTVPLTLARSAGNAHRALVPMDASPFGSLSAPVSFTAEVTATDAAGNVSTQSVSRELTVTRLRWSRTVDPSSPSSVTAAAVDGTGNVYVGSTTYPKLYVLGAAKGDVVHAWPHATAQGIGAPPSVGAQAVWVASKDGKVYAVDPASGAWSPACSSGGALVATPALVPGAPDRAFVPSSATAGPVLYATSDGACASPAAGEPFVAPAAIDADGAVYVASQNGGLFRFALDGGGAFAATWPAAVGAGSSVTSPIAVAPGPCASPLCVWFTSANAGLFAVPAAASPPPSPTAVVPTLSVTTASPVVDGAGRILLPDRTRDGSGVHYLLRRFRPIGAPLPADWTAPPEFASQPLSPMAFRGGTAYVVPTEAGELYALAEDGTKLWHGTVKAEVSLQEGNAVRLPGESFSTAVFGADDGVVYAVLVDGRLDGSAPWPRSHHDPQNTANVQTPIP